MSTITLFEAETGQPWSPGRRLRPEPVPLAPRSDDEHLAFLLVATWSLRTGRRLRHAPPDQLTEAELLEFWSDPEYGRSPVAPACGPRPDSCSAGRCCRRRSSTGSGGGGHVPQNHPTRATGDVVTGGPATSDRRGGRS
ncbi:hypothetical protein E1200_12405 [Actinomadura sp. GC306]|uniref:hypothetical protein n=1 Tax=Actinomadura sp. GC306 TaxID=2530367 RepID=UPI00104A215F|nr:hypothetical protein [Actinomadura sp. GC306]TDC68234.1 hypothetical protein E1200_12405 [Actinomadura sp. GC306]